MHFHVRAGREQCFYNLEKSYSFFARGCHIRVTTAAADRYGKATWEVSRWKLSNQGLREKRSRYR